MTDGRHGEAVNRRVERRREEGRSINIHIEANPDEDGVQELATDVCELVRAEESPSIEIADLTEWSDIPKGSAILVEMPEEAWEHPEEYYEEWTELVRKLHTSRVGQYYPIIVSEDVPKDVKAVLDFRVRPSDESGEWYKMKVDAFGGDFYEVKVGAE